MLFTGCACSKQNYHPLFYSVVLSSPSVMSIREGTVGGLQFCLTVTGFPGIIFKREFQVKSFPASGMSKTATVSVHYHDSCYNSVNTHSIHLFVCLELKF